MAGTTAISIGNFDGVHRGHRALLERARAGVGPPGRVVAVTFDPHPAAVLRPGEAPAKLLDLPDRIARLREAGADDVLVLDATKALLATSAEEFVEDLHRRFSFDLVVEGPGFRFGRGRAGTIAMLKATGERLGFRVEVVEAVTVVLRDRSSAPASSSLVRLLLRLGRVEDAVIVLGRAFEIDGRVVRGEQRGRVIGFPTTNVDHGDIVLPADGIYAADAFLPDGTRLPAAVSVGSKPTFGNGERVCEAHILDFAGWREDYGWTLRLSFRAWIREQLRFDSIEALVDQIQCDVARVRTLCGSAEEVAA